MAKVKRKLTRAQKEAKGRVKPLVSKYAAKNPAQVKAAVIKQPV